MELARVWRFTRFYGVLATAFVFTIFRVADTWSVNQVSLGLAHLGVADTAISLFGIGLPPNGSAHFNEKNLTWSTPELLNPNWDNRDSLLRVSEYESIHSTLNNLFSHLPSALSIAAKLLHLELWLGQKSGVLAHLEELARDTRCDVLDSSKIGCYILWTDLGDASDQSGQTEKALTFYSATNWYGRREAATELALQLADQETQRGSLALATKWTLLAQELLPDLLAVKYAGWAMHIGTSDESLIMVKEPQLLFYLAADPRLERRNAGISMVLVTQKKWSVDTLHRVLAIRALQVDTQQLTYGRHDSVRQWSPEIPFERSRIRALEAYFDRMAELLPSDPYVWFYAAEVSDRSGDCERAALLYNRAYALSPMINILHSVPRFESPCALPSYLTPLTKQMENVIDVSMANWWSYGQPVGLTVASSDSHGYGYDATWIWSPDTTRHLRDSASFRADCLWSSVTRDPSYLRLTIVEKESGQIRRQPLRQGESLEVEYAWQIEDGVTLTPDFAEGSNGGIPMLSLKRRDVFDPNTGWISTVLTIPKANYDRVIELRWMITGCGHVWLDHVGANIISERH